VINILITDPNPAFGGMTQQVLEETGNFNVTLVTSGADTVTAAGRASFDIVIVEAALDDLSLHDLIKALRLNQPTLPIIVALPLGEEALPDAAKVFDVQGILSKPFYIPDLVSQIEEALSKPVGGVTPPLRVAQPSAPPQPAARPAPASTTNTATTATQTKRPTPLKRATPPAPAWLNDVNRAAQHLTALTLESSAEAALLMRGQQLIAFAGQCSKAEADELASTVAANWAKETDPGGGAQVRFLRLSSGADYLVYSTLAAQDLVLSMAFQAETPLGQIRKQAKRATDALIAPPVETTNAAVVSSPAPSPVVESTATPSSPAPVKAAPVPEPARMQTEVSVEEQLPISKIKTKPLPPLPDFTPKSSSSPSPATEIAHVDDIEIGLDWTSALHGGTPLPDAFQPDWTPATHPHVQPDPDVEPIPDEESLNNLSKQLQQLERQALIEQPLLLDLPPAPLPNIRRTPHGLYDLSYTFLFLPRLPHITLAGDLKARLEQWLIALADTHDWDATTIKINEDHVEVSLNCAPADSPERVIKTILTETSDKILEEYPRLAAAHAKRPGAFWASGYYVVTPGRRLAPEEVTAFVEYQRREQSGGKL